MIDMLRVILLLTLAWTAPAMSERLPRPPLDVDVVGELRTVKALHEDTLLDIARRNDLGQDEIFLANPTIDRWLPGEGTEVVLPTRYILPAANRSGIVLNVPEMRMYYFPPSQQGQADVIDVYPVSIGRMDWDTPLGGARITAKTKDPSWRPPASIRKEAEERGEPLPEIIPPGPDNPLGRYAMRLSRPGYLIHSTNKPFGVGMRVTHGCVRMYPEDIEMLFPNVPVNTKVQIVDQPVKVGWFLDTLYIEVHPPLEENRSHADLLQQAMDLVNEAWLKRPLTLDVRALREAVEQRHGIPVAVAEAK